MAHATCVITCLLPLVRQGQRVFSARQAVAWVPEAEADLLAVVQRWTVAYSHALQAHLREDGDFRAVLQVLCGMGCGKTAVRFMCGG